MKNKDGFSDLKIKYFEVLDAARDVQLRIESVQHELEGNGSKINRYIGKRANWMYHHKYALKDA
jgi:hypothetical protein